MDTKDYYIVKEEIALVISELNSKEILSSQDKIEIEDHFYCDVEELVNSGLSTKEALLVARSRFGELDGIREDYEIVKPESNLLYFGVIGILIFSCVKGLYVAIDILSNLFWYTFSVLGQSVRKDNLWLDIPARLFLFISGIMLMLHFVKRSKIINFNRFWYIPLIYLLLEVLGGILDFFILQEFFRRSFHNTDSHALLLQMENLNIISWFLGLSIISIISSFSLLKLKRNENRYV
mgnify:CR=1 FL=1|tara:strand:- start:2128 stop:2835 length:708 start_codon:yes stop_codon:yes gene_type:complete